MPDVKVNIYEQNGKLVGYFLDPKVEAFPEGDYSIEGRFFSASDELFSRIDFNPEALPYSADVSGVRNLAHPGLKNVYVQRGRQPVIMTGSGSNG